MSSGTGMMRKSETHRIDIHRLGKKQMDLLASMQNDVATATTSAYGKKLMQKMGWNE